METASDGNDFANNGVISLDRLSEVTGLAYADGRISWNSVAGADKYEIYLNGSLVDSVYDTYYVLVDASKTPARTDVYTVRACADGAMSSAMSTESVSIRYLAAANNVSINGTVLSWNAVDGAEGYAVYANGKIVETVDATKLSFNLLGTLEKGDYSIKVVPVGNSESVIAPEVTDTINYTVNETIIYISTEQDLYNVRLDLSAVYILKNDITLTKAWSPIGNTATPFNGKFNGGGYTITGVQISATSGEGTGLFGVIGEDGTVYNVVLADVSCESGSYGNVAGLAGINRGTVYGVKVYGSVSAKGSDYIGGIVGRNYGSIYDCVNYADVTGRKNVGGISGGSEISDYSTQIYNCENNGSVNGSFRVGGIMGNVQITKKITVYGLTNNGEVVCSGDYCGGIFGNVSGSSGQIGTLNACVNNASVTGTGYVGGCFGNVGGYITVTLDNVSDTSQNCVNNGTVTATGGNKYGQIYPGE